MKRIAWIVGLSLFCTTAARAQTVIDFDNLGLSEGAPIGTIGIATFHGEAGVVGGPAFGFGGGAGPDTGLSPPFDASLNTFLCNPGGVASPDTTKIITVDFSHPVSRLSFAVCDIDSYDIGGAGETIERVTAEIFDASMTPLGLVQHIAPPPTNGDGAVVVLDFGAIGCIRTLRLTLDNAGSYQPETALGWGVDNLTFRTSPRVFSVNPSIGSFRGGTTVTVAGCGFDSSSEIFFGGLPATSVRLISEFELEAVTPASNGPFIPFPFVTWMPWRFGRSVDVMVRAPTGRGPLPRGFVYQPTLR